MDAAKKNFSILEWAKALSMFMLSLAICLKIYTTPTTITVDFPTLLSLLLALFSVGLSALFYFKATDTSNAFYDNTYKFTKDIAELLVKIESGFGERLKHLDEGYTSMRDYFQNGTTKSAKDVEVTRDRLASEKQEIEKVRAERDEIVSRLIEQSALQQGEKDRITQELRTKEEELAESQRQLSRLNRHLTVERVARRRGNARDAGMEGFTSDNVIRKMEIEPGNRVPVSVLRRKFDDISGSLPRGYLEDMERHGFFDNGLTVDGAHFLREILQDKI